MNVHMYEGREKVPEVKVAGSEGINIDGKVQLQYHGKGEIRGKTGKS